MKIRKIILLSLTISFLGANMAHATSRIQAECLSSVGKMKACAVQSDGRELQIDFRSTKFQDLRIDGRKIQGISGGEYSRRRVFEAVLLTPWLLFSKKKRDTFGIEYKNSFGQNESILIQVHKKYGLGMKSLLESSSGKKVVMDLVTSKKKNK